MNLTSLGMRALVAASAIMVGCAVEPTGDPVPAFASPTGPDKGLGTSPSVVIPATHSHARSAGVTAWQVGLSSEQLVLDALDANRRVVTSYRFHVLFTPAGPPGTAMVEVSTAPGHAVGVMADRYLTNPRSAADAELLLLGSAAPDLDPSSVTARDDVEWISEDPRDFTADGGEVLFRGAAAGARRFSEVRLNKAFADLAFGFFR